MQHQLPTRAIKLLPIKHHRIAEPPITQIQNTTELLLRNQILRIPIIHHILSNRLHKSLISGVQSANIDGAIPVGESTVEHVFRGLVPRYRALCYRRWEVLVDGDDVASFSLGALFFGDVEGVCMAFGEGLIACFYGVEGCVPVAVGVVFVAVCHPFGVFVGAACG